jgi:hypothetical protein
LAGEQEAKDKLGAFVLAENRRREAEQHRLDEEARKRAIAEAKKDGDAQLATAIKNGTVPVVSQQQVAAPVKIEGFSARMVKDGTVPL